MKRLIQLNTLLHSVHQLSGLINGRSWQFHLRNESWLTLILFSRLFNFSCGRWCCSSLFFQKQKYGKWKWKPKVSFQEFIFEKICCWRKLKRVENKSENKCDINRQVCKFHEKSDKTDPKIWQKRLVKQSKLIL